MNTNAEECLIHAVRVMMEKGIIRFFPFSWCFGLVDMRVESEMFADEETVLTVREDDWNGGPAECVVQELAQAMITSKVRFIPVKSE
ncbi:MAG: hypothetical protein HFG05_07495 [Oscillibacter sp.]|nr:hypothetical protein [Oscillibacter sp.]